jgi:hypothetical protein
MAVRPAAESMLGLGGIPTEALASAAEFSLGEFPYDPGDGFFGIAEQHSCVLAKE